MNADDDSPLEPAEDPLFDEAIARLKRLEPPLQTRINNRVIVADALKSLSRAGQSRAWWRRSISIPLPLAAALAVIFAVALSQNLRAGRERAAVEVMQPVGQSDRRTNDLTGIAPETPKDVARSHDLRPDRQSYAKETYLCGLGRLRFESANFSKEQSR